MNFKIIMLFIVFFQYCNLFAQNKQDDVVNLSGTSIIGTKELPRSLFIVPWNNTEAVDDTSLNDMLGDNASIIDRESFVREVSYYEFLENID